MTKLEIISQRYTNGYIKLIQLDGTGAEPNSIYKTRNYVALGVITQEQADQIKSLAQ